LEGNTYLKTSVGAKGAVVSVEGFPIVISKDETYQSNINWFEPIFFEEPPFGSSKSFSPFINRDFLVNYEYKS
jgi:hypothetical protein